MKITFTAKFPGTKEDWDNEVVQEWKEKYYEIDTQELASIALLKWGGINGVAIYFTDGWHFTTSPIFFKD